jgi:hypothetical protein
MRTMSSDRPLPDLPGSTEQDLKQNSFHPFFKKTTREIWESAEIEHHVIQKKEPCDHFFRYVKGGVECTRCHMGLEGHLDIKGGKLFFKGQQILS